MVDLTKYKIDTNYGSMIFDESKEFIDSLKRGTAQRVNVICESCGERRDTEYRVVVLRGSTICGSCSRKTKHKNLVGEVFGDLTVISLELNKKGRSRAVVQCTCGRTFCTRTNNLLSGGSTSCGFSHLNYGKRGDHKYNSWAKSVKEKYNYTCMVCGSTEKIIAHHLESYAYNEESRYDIENGVALCRDCHVDFHINFMGNYKTYCKAEDFEQYLLQV